MQALIEQVTVGDLGTPLRMPSLARHSTKRWAIESGKNKLQHKEIVALNSSQYSEYR